MTPLIAFTNLPLKAPNMRNRRTPGLPAPSTLTRTAAATRTLAMAAGLALGTLYTALPVRAQTPASPAAEARQGYRIAPGPLGQVLNAFASAVGLELTVDAQLLQGRQSAGLNGSYAVREGFAEILRGHALQATRETNGSYSLRATRPGAPAHGAAPHAEATLPAMQVSAQPVKDGMTESTGSYTTTSSRTATKLDLSLRETPQTVTVVTRQKMDDFGLANIDDVLESSSTISVLRRGGDGAAYYSRGFALQSQFDGIPNPIGIGESNRGPAPDTAFLDKVEILQGASGLMGGAGDPGGTINLVRKRPTEQFQAHVESQLGSWNKKRLVADVSGALVASGRVRGRAVALRDHGDAFTGHVYDNRQGFYAIVEADVTATATASASAMYQKNDFNMHYGVPRNPNGADLGLPRSAFYGLANGDSTKELTGYTLNLDQKLPADWLLKAAYTHTGITGDNVVNNLSGTLNPVTGGGLRVSSALQQREFESDVLDVYASGPFQLLERKHELILGASSARMKDKSRLTSPFVYVPIDNIHSYEGAPTFQPSGHFSAWPVANKTMQRGVYGAVRLNLADTLKLILGTRVSWYAYEAAGVRQQKEDAVVSPYAGLVYDIGTSTSVYASYSDIFKPQSNLKFGGGTIDPIAGKNHELGVKSELLQGRLNASAAVFRLEQTNLSQVDTSVPETACNGGRCYTAAGLVVSKGVDLGLNGELLPGWQAGVGYTWVHREYGSGANQGKAYGTYMPRQILRAYTAYLIPGTDWTVGGNVRAQSGMYTEGSGFRIEQGGYTIVGLMAKYRINKQAEVGMTINNLFDHRYYESIGSYGTNLENFYGAPRNVAVNLKYAF